MKSTIHAVVHDRHITVAVPDGIPDGTSVEVRVVPIEEQWGIDESQWKCDAAAMTDWNVWLESIEPIDFATPGKFEDAFQAHNVDAVRKQMFGEQP